MEKLRPFEVEAIRARLGFNAIEMGRVCGLEGNDDTVLRAVRRWETNSGAISGPASLLLRYMDQFGAPEVLDPTVRI